MLNCVSEHFKEDRRWGKSETEKGSKAYMTLIVLSQGLFSLPCDPSTAELSDTSSATLTRRCRRLN